MFVGMGMWVRTWVWLKVQTGIWARVWLCVCEDMGVGMSMYMFMGVVIMSVFVGMCHGSDDMGMVKSTCLWAYEWVRVGVCAWV
jgi:hypothetical protein